MMRILSIFGTRPEAIKMAPVVRAQLDLPEDRDILCAISFGYADLDHSANKFRTHRAGLDEVVTWCE